MRIFERLLQPSKIVRTSWRLLVMLVSLWTMLFAPAASGQVIIFQEDFESGQGDWYADNGVWEIDTLVVWPGGPDSCHSGQQCAGTIINANYPPNANTRLISPSINLPAVSENEKIRLYFWHWFTVDEIDALGPDKGLVQISVNGGAFQPQAGLAGPFAGLGVVWTQVCVDLTSYAGSQVRLAFYFTSTERVQVAGWYVDDILILKNTSTFTLVDFPESFETGMGDWYADNGVWEIGRPLVGPIAIKDGDFCAATVLDGNYSPNANTRLVSPEIELPILVSPERLHLHFWHWFVTNEDDALGPDEGRVQLSVDNGPWENILEPVAGSSSVWTHVSIDLSKYAGKAIRLAFYFTSSSRDEASGWYVDSVSIHKIPNRFNISNNPESFEQGIGEWWADNGVWEVGHPTVCPMNGRNSSNCAATILDGNYPNLANSRLISAEFKLGSMSSQPLSLCFWHWYRMNETDALGPDRGYVQISVDRGPWKNIAGPYSGISELWTRTCVDLSAYADSTVRIAFYFVSSSRAADCGWFIDDIDSDGLVAVHDRSAEERESFMLSPNFPNPFNPSTTILYGLPRASEVEIAIFNLLGEKIRTLANQKQASGQHRIQWDGRDEYGQHMPSGVYLYRLKTREFEQTRKMILMQ